MITRSLVLSSIALGLSVSANNENTLPMEAINTYTEAFDIIKSRHIHAHPADKLVSLSLKGLLAELDPHSSFLDSKALKALEEHTSGNFSGIGVELTMNEKRQMIIVTTLPDSPAEAADLKSNDVIIGINGKPIIGHTFEQSLNQLDGKLGEQVTLTIKRESIEKPIDVTLTREKLDVKSIAIERIDDEIVLAKITHFNSKTDEHFHEQLLNILGESEQDKQQVILDLRNNPGGLLRPAVDIANMFLTSGVITSVQGRRATDNQVFNARHTTIFKEVGVVILINEGTASSAEILAAALKDAKRAVVLGVKSFGKGSVQSVIRLTDGSAIKLTTAQYMTPNNESIQAKGITPTIEIKQHKLTEATSKLEVREADLSNHLSNNAKDMLGKKKIEKHYLEDFQLYEAIKISKALLINKT